MKTIILIMSLWLGTHTPPVITACRPGYEPVNFNRFISDNYYRIYPPFSYLNNMVFHYNGVVAGKWGLSPKYESLEQLEELMNALRNRDLKRYYELFNNLATESTEGTE